jgi:F420-dependent hydroxymycolic acid dehydrogenase
MSKGSPPSRDQGAALHRRDMLKSAGALLAASAAGLSNTGVTATRKSSSGEQHSGALRKRMLGFMLAHEQFVVPELIRLGAAAERAGFDLLATSDHFQPWQANERHAGQAWVTLGALGQQTRGIWMGPTVTCPTLRYHPAVVAEAFATLGQLYPGRIFLGLGSGEALNEQAATGQWPAWRERWDRLIEAVSIIRQLWSGQPVQHKGTHYTVNGRLYDIPAKPIPLLLAANGPKAMKLAGEHGDGLVTDPKTWQESKTEWESGARAAGKNPAQIERRAQSELPLSKVYGDWTVSRDPTAHIEAINKLFDSGVSIVNVHSGQPDQQKVIEFYGKEVVPRLKAKGDGETSPIPASPH